MQTLFIVQGPSGSGKSTFAEALEKSWPSLMICCTDDYFVNCQTGEYKFDPSKLAENHLKNQEQAAKYLREGYSVIVPNTNLQNWEVRPYVQVADEYDIPVVFVRMTGQFNNLHGVPEDKVKLMRERMEELTVEKALVAKAPWEK